MDCLMLTYSFLPSRTASTKHRGAPKQNARCWRGHKFGARKQPLWNPFSAATQLESSSDALWCRVRSNGNMARREPRLCPELLHEESEQECCRLMARCTFDARRHSWQRYDDARFITQPRQSAAVFIEKWFRCHNTCQVIMEIDWRSVQIFIPIWPSRKISAHEFERGGLLKPIVNTIDGTPTFLSISSQNDSTMGSVQHQNGTTSSINRTQRLSRNELKHLDEKEMIFELVIIKKRFRNLMIYNFLSRRFRSRISAMNWMLNLCVIKSFKMSPSSWTLTVARSSWYKWSKQICLEVMDPKSKLKQIVLFNWKLNQLGLSVLKL